MITRSYDSELISKIVSSLTKDNIKIDSIDWVSNLKNVMLINDLGDVAVFEHISEGQVNGHYYFKSRGKQALQSARDFLDEVLNEWYNIKVIRGFIPLVNLGARWISRQLGFKSQGILRINCKPYELFILHHLDYIK